MARNFRKKWDKHLGATSELRACVWLMESGYEVFRAVSQHGKVDLIAVDPKNHSLILIDVKSTTLYEETRVDGAVMRYSSGAIEPPGSKIKYLYVYSDGAISWERRQTEMVSPPTRSVKFHGKIYLQPEDFKK